MNLSKTTLLLLAILGLSVLLGASAVADPGNDNPQEATDVYDGSDWTATVTAAGGGNPADEDWFRIYLTDGQFLKVGLFFDPNAGPGWIYVHVYGPDDHTKLASTSRRTPAGGWAIQEIDQYIFANGTYYIRAWIVDGTSAQYRAIVQAYVPPIVTSGERVGNGGDPLWPWVDSSRQYRIWLEGTNQTSEICEVSLTWAGDFDVNLIVYDRKDNYHLNILNYSWSRSYDHSESLRFAASYTGYYYIQVYTNNPVVNDPSVIFSMQANILVSKHRADGNVARADAELIKIRKLVKGKIDQAFDTHEWFTFYLNKDEQFSAKASIADPHLTTYWDYYNLTLYTDNGTIVAGAVNEGSTGAPISSCSIFLGRAPYTGKYYMSFSASMGWSGAGTTDYTNGKLVNTCRYEIDILIPNRRVWIVEPPDVITMFEDGEWTEDLTKVFWDPEGDELFYGTLGGKTNFTLVLSQSTGKLTIQPNPNWYGSEAIQIWAHDGRPDMKNTTTVLVMVKSVPDPPFVMDGAPITVRIWEDEVNTTALTLKNVFDDVDIEDKFLLYSSDQNEYVNVEIDQTSGRVTLYALEDYNGQQKLNFYAADSYNYRVSHQITVIVRPTNDPPVAVGKIPRIPMIEGINAFIDVGEYFEDIDGDELYYYAEWDQEDAIAFDNADSNPINSWFDVYPEDRDFYGFVQVIFICYDRDPLDPDEEAEEARQSAILEVENVNDAPKIDVWTPDYDPDIFELEYVTFAVPEIMIDDVDSTTFRWKWFVNDVEQVDIAGESFDFPKEPGYDDAGTYIVRCEVKDSLGEPANIVPEWRLVIKNTNRAPTVNLLSTDSEVEEGIKIRLRADGYDQDDDSLIFEWYQIDDDGREQKIGLGRDFVMDKVLPPGSYRFKCKVSDGTDSVGSDYVQVDIKRHEFAPTIPGFGTALAVLAITGAIAVTSRRRR